MIHTAQLRRVAGLVLLSLGSVSAQSEVVVSTASALRQAVERASPGTQILLAPGTYEGGISLGGLRGEAGKPIVLAAQETNDPPVVKGGTTGMHLTDPAYVELRDLVFEDARVNGLNIDDGGSFDTPAHHVVLEDLVVRDLDPGGNHDGIKLSGVDSFRVEGCTVERWGKRGGSAIDMVGCHNGVIEECTFRHDEEAAPNSGVQAKGGTRGITIRRNRFENAGGRAVNLGGSTGLQFFRPPLKKGDEHYQAKDLAVLGNTFIGSLAPIAFVGVDGAKVRLNTIYCPKRWAIRILQETRAPGFVASRNGEFSDNLVVFRSDWWSEGGVKPNSPASDVGAHALLE